MPPPRQRLWLSGGMFKIHVTTVLLPQALVLVFGSAPRAAPRCLWNVCAQGRPLSGRTGWAGVRALAAAGVRLQRLHALVSSFVSWG